MSDTTIRDLIDRLEELADEHGDSTAILVVHQENYPLRETIRGTWVSGTTFPCPEEGCDETFTIAEAVPDHLVAEHEYDAADIAQEEQEQVAYLVLGGHPYSGSPYGERIAFEDCERF